MFNLITLFGAIQGTIPEGSSRKIEASLLIDEGETAVKLAEEALALFPNDPYAHTLLIRSLGLKGEEGKMMEAWENMKKQFPEKAFDDSLLEAMAFSIVRKGKRSSNLDIRKVTLIAAALTEDVEGALAIKEALRDSNAQLRLIGVELAALYGDDSLREEIIRLFHEETSKEVRRSLYKAIATLKVDLTDNLIEYASKEAIAFQEKGEILKAIIALTEKVDRQTLEKFAKSRSFVVRSLVAHEIAKSLDKRDADLLTLLLDDFHPEVKKSALDAMAVLKVGEVAKIKSLAFSGKSEVGISAARVLLLLDEKEGEKAFRYWLSNEKIEVKRKASAALASLGERACGLSSEFLSSNSDPYVIAHLSLNLLYQRKEIGRASQMLFHFLSTVKEPLMRNEEFYSCLEKSTLTVHPLITNFREASDRAVRLELLNLLAVVDCPKAKEAIRDFLKEKRGDVVGIAAEILLKEGDEEIITILKDFLQGPDKKLMRESALLLAALKENDSIPILKGLYFEASLIQKLTILETMGRLGERELIAFFVEELKNPSETIRIASASMLIHTLRS